MPGCGGNLGVWGIEKMVRILVGDCCNRLKELQDKSVQLCVTSPPYFGLRDYGVDGQLGLELTPQEYIDNLVKVFREVRRTLRDDGCLVLNLGDSYAGSGKGPTGHNGMGDQAKRQGFHSPPVQLNNYKPKDLMGIPWRVALALQADGWYLRSAMPWLKASAMPESVRDRPTTAHEYVFLLAKSSRYYWDAEAIRIGSQVYRRKAGGYDISRGMGEGTGGQDGRRALGFKERDVMTVGRNYRTTDAYIAPLEHAIVQVRAELTRLEALRDTDGLLLNEEGNPVALRVNPGNFKGSHFATFPVGLVEPFVRAGTSEKGECPECGNPWERVIEKKRSPTRPGRISSTDYTAPHLQSKGSGGNTELRYRYETSTTTVDWRPTCEHIRIPSSEKAFDGCIPDPVPQTVLDPFGGAGTTALVADRLGRNAIVCELNPDYVEMTRQRLVDDGGMFMQVEVE